MIETTMFVSYVVVGSKLVVYIKLSAIVLSPSRRTTAEHCRFQGFKNKTKLAFDIMLKLSTIKNLILKVKVILFSKLGRKFELKAVFLMMKYVCILYVVLILFG